MAGAAAVGDVLVCTAVDATTNECTQQTWMPPPQLLPEMSAAQGGAISAAIIALWVIGWAWKQARKATNSGSG